MSDLLQKTQSRVERFSTSGRTLVDSVIELAYKYQVPMAIEYADWEATMRPLNLEFHKKSFVIAKRTPSCKKLRPIAMLQHEQALKEGVDEVAKAGFRAS